MLILLVIVIFIIIIGLIVLYQYNKIVALKMKVEQSESGIDVYSQQRFDLIPNLVEIVKEYSEYEEKTFKQILELRSKYLNTKDLKTGEILDKNLNDVILTVENYPNLKANEQFLNLQKNLVKMENQLQAARRIYNYDVTKYNTQISIVPFNIVAKMFKFKEAELFDFDDKNKTN